MRKNLSLNLLFEASQQMIDKMLQDNEEWLDSSIDENQRKERINYLLSMMQGVDDSSFENLPPFIDKNHLKNLKLRSKESYGWLDQLSPKERDNELKDEKLKPEYDFHKQFMKNNDVDKMGRNSKNIFNFNMDMGGSKNLVKTDNLEYFEKYKTKALSDDEIYENNRISDGESTNNVAINNKIIGFRITESSDKFTIINSNITAFNKNGAIVGLWINNSKIVNSNLIINAEIAPSIEGFNILNSTLFCKKRFPYMEHTVNIENSVIKCDGFENAGYQARVSALSITDCHIVVPNATLLFTKDTQLNSVRIDKKLFDVAAITYPVDIVFNKEFVNIFKKDDYSRKILSRRYEDLKRINDELGKLRKR